MKYVTVNAKDLADLLDYIYPIELKHYLECDNEQKKNHIIETIARIKSCVE